MSDLRRAGTGELARGGWRGLGQQIGNYNAPFLYLLAR